MRFFKAVFLSLILFSVAVTPGLSETVLKLQSSQNSGDFTFRFLTEKWAPRLETMSSGQLKLEILPTRSVVPHRETIDAVAIGVLDGDLNAVSYFSGRDPALALVGDLIAGYDTPDQLQTFCMNGGGKELLQKIYDTLLGNAAVKVIGCGPYAREALVAKEPIRSLDDLQGVKIRSPEGLAAEVFKRAGATPVALPFSEVYTSLEKGIVDAADASAYSNNHATGLHKVAKYPIYPGIHSMAVLQFIVNGDVWRSLSPAHREMISVWYLAAYTDLRRHADLEDRRIVAADRAGAGSVEEIIDWPQADRDRFREIARGAWEDFSNSSPLAAEAYDTHVKFMKLYGLLK